MPVGIVAGQELIESFTAGLKAQGYAESTIRGYTTAYRHYIVWLYLSNLRLRETDGGVLQRFLAHDCSCAHPQFFTPPGCFSASYDGEHGHWRWGRPSGFLSGRTVAPVLHALPILISPSPRDGRSAGGHGRAHRRATGRTGHP